MYIIVPHQGIRKGRAATVDDAVMILEPTILPFMSPRQSVNSQELAGISQKRHTWTTLEEQVSSSIGAAIRSIA
jgi:hypothetical protein